MITRIALSVTFTVLAAISCFAQGLVPERPSEKTKVESRYDSSKDESTVLVVPYLLILAANDYDPAERITLTFSFTYSGRTLPAPASSIKLHIVSKTRFGWEFEKPAERSLYVKVDGEKISLGTANLVEAKRVAMHSAIGNMTRFFYVEEVTLFVPAEIVQKMVNGKKINIHVGNYEQRLSKQNLEILREVLSRVGIK
jgi:hypothetical protein